MNYKEQRLREMLDYLQDSLIDAQGNPNDLALDVLQTLYDDVCNVVTQYEEFQNKEI